MNQKDIKLVMIEETKLKELKLGLNELKLSVEDAAIRKKINKMIDILDSRDEEQTEDVGERIYKKMKDTDDPELNVKLYMLYRKLEEGKVDEAEALRQYNLYVGQEYTSGYVF